MSRRKVPGKEALIEALRECDGNQAAVARKFGCHRDTINKYVLADPELQEIVDELTETFIDEAESQLFKLIREGQPAAIIFFLKTRARSRGYSERFELSLVQHNIEVELGGPNIEDNQVKTLNGNGAAKALLGE